MALPRHVAYSTGFHDQRHFTRRFRQDVGVSPGRWARVEGGGTEMDVTPGAAADGELGD